jgi:pimeloyl-ACP methyl ester carboxylesterase
MNREILKRCLVALTALLLALCGSRAFAQENGKAPLVIAGQGSFFVGGTTVTAPGTFDPTQFFPVPDDGQTFRIDHLYAQYQVPPGARDLAIVFVHGAGQTGKTWESTPDGREGYQSIFLRRGFKVYTVDFPRRGRAGFPSFNGPLGTLGGTPLIPDYTTRFGDQQAFISFRLGPQYPEYFPNSRFGKAGLDQFLRQIVPFVIDDYDLISSQLAALLEKTGPSVLVTHSQSGMFGWLTAIKSPNVMAIVSYEPGEYVFPEGQVPFTIPLYSGISFPAGAGVPPQAFARMTQIPIQIVWGDNIPADPTPVFGLDIWRVVQDSSQKFADAVNSAGGNVTILKLPEKGLMGNTHFPFSDMNNAEVADLLSAFLREQGLDRRGER